MPKILGEALFIAVKNNKKEDVKQLLSNPDIDLDWQCSETGNTAMHCAAENDEYELALLLLDRDARADIENHQKFTAINSAVLAGHWKFVERFAKRRKAKDNDQYGLAVANAANQGEFDAMLALLESGASPNWQHKDNKQTSLHIAAKANNPKMIRALRSYGANASLVDSNNKTPVDVATDIAKQNENSFEAVLAFNQQPDLHRISKPIIEDLEDVILTVSTRPYMNYFTRRDWHKLAPSDAKAYYKDSILEQILALKDPVLKQRALWQALDPNTFLGKFFRYKRGVFPPQINAGRLKKIRKGLQNLLLTNRVVVIDSEVKNNIYHDLQIIRYFPQLVSKYPICRVQETITDVTPTFTPHEKWFEQVYGGFWGNWGALEDHKENAFHQICDIQNPNLRQRAFWQALDPNTYLGKIFHTKRGLYKPNYQSGLLKAICDQLQIILKDHELVIDASVKDALRHHPYIIKNFGRLRNANPLNPADQHEFKEEASPPAYSSIVGNAVPQPLPVSSGSTALIMQAASFIPQPNVTPGAHLLVPTDEVKKDIEPSAPSQLEKQAVPSISYVPAASYIPMPITAVPERKAESERTNTEEHTSRRVLLA